MAEAQRESKKKGSDRMQENEQTADEREAAPVKKGIIEALGGNYYECMQALDKKFLS